MNFENLNIWCWIIPSLVGIISGILGYLIGKGGTPTIDFSTEVKSLTEKSTKLEADLAACNKKLSAVVSTPSEDLGSIDLETKATDEKAFDRVVAKAFFGKNIKKDDLKLVEGIGPKIEGLFHNFEIKTWKALSETSVSKCKEVLLSGGSRYKMHDPSSWPMQSKMCYEGKWKNLSKWQDQHKRGKY